MSFSVSLCASCLFVPDACFKRTGMDGWILRAGDTEVLVRCPWVAMRATLLHQLLLCPSTAPPLHTPQHGRRGEALTSLCRSGRGIRRSSSQTSLFSGMMSSALCLLSSRRVWWFGTAWQWCWGLWGTSASSASLPVAGRRSMSPAFSSATCHSLTSWCVSSASPSLSYTH